MDRGSGDLAGSTADQSDTPAGRAHRTEWQHHRPETGGNVGYTTHHLQM